MQRALSAALIGFSLAGCAANSGVVPTGQDTFMVSRQAASGFSNISGLTPDALNESGISERLVGDVPESAHTRCANVGKTVQRT